jgi:hypothetical protein
VTAPDPRRAIITGQLVGRWIAELGTSIRRFDGTGYLPLPVGAWDVLDDGDRVRLAEIGNDLLVRLDDAGALVGVGQRAILKRVTRDHLGRPLGSPPADGARAGAGPTCRCGRPETLGTVHRLTGPCFVVEKVVGIDPPNASGR